VRGRNLTRHKPTRKMFLYCRDDHKSRWPSRRCGQLMKCYNYQPLIRRHL